jgi:hypothetical protein
MVGMQMTTPAAATQVARENTSASSNWLNRRKE